MSQTVSAIIPTRNSGPYMERCLTSVMGQTYRDIEVIVVDNHSTDETERIAKSFGVQFITAGDERSRQTNIGVAASRGQIIWRTDSDCVFDRTLVEEAVQKLDEGFEAVTVSGTMDTSMGLWSRVRKAERDALVGDWAHTAPSFFKRDAFFAVRGFNENLNAFEEYDLGNKLLRGGYSIGHISAKWYHLGEPKNLAEVVRKYVFVYGNKRNVRVFARENPGKGMWQIAPLRLVYLKHIRQFGLLFYPFLIYHYVRYTSALIGFIISS
jgi:glycosyltransferase involved in cell wall biosynthesis